MPAGSRISRDFQTWSKPHIAVLEQFLKKLYEEDSLASVLEAASTSNALSVLSQGLSVLSQQVSVMSQFLSVRDAALSVRIDTQSQAISVLSNQVSVLSQQISVHSQAISVLSQQISVLSQQTSTLSQAISVLSQQVSILSVRTSFAGYGQCRISVKSTTSLALQPYAGSKIWISASAYSIPSAGIEIGNGGLVSGTTYFVYAFISAVSVITLEITTSTHATDTIAGNVGVEIKSGDSSRTLVGMVRLT